MADQPLTALAQSWETEADEIDVGPGDLATWTAAKTLRECAAQLRSTMEKRHG